MLYAVSRGKRFLVERYCDGDELWLPFHPDSKDGVDNIVINFDRTFEEIMHKDADVILSSTTDGLVEIIYLRNGKPQDFSLVQGRLVPLTIKRMEEKFEKEKS